MKTIFILSLFFISLSANAYLENDSPDRFSGLKQMNGYKFTDYVGFQKKWNLVTVRFRKDTGELRFTYANPLAWKTLLSGKTDYPDGAVFAKIGYMSETDPLFPSSAVPSGARRYQFMVRNTKKHKETEGWGYALFDSHGLTFPEDPKVQTQACAACHRIAPEREYVFSQPMEPSLTIKAMRAAYKAENKFEFAEYTKSSLPKQLQDLLDKNEKVNSLEGPLRKNIFQGTLDEVTPILVESVVKNKTSSVLANTDFSRFTLVSASSDPCMHGLSIVVFQTQTEKNKDGLFVIKQKHFCHE